MEFFGYGTIILIILLDLTSFVTSSLTASFFRKYVDEQTDFKNKNINDSGYDLFINLKWEFYDGWILVICTAVMNVIMSLLAIKISALLVYINHVKIQYKYFSDIVVLVVIQVLEDHKFLY